jgi:hypothetical protein
MNDEFLTDLSRTMAEYGFRSVPITAALSDVTLLLKRQTWNTNRAIVVACPAQIPPDIRVYLHQLRRQIAFKCGFFPVFWGIGIQVIVIAPGLSKSGIDPAQHIARVDNQWAIVQSIFLADSASRTYQSGRTWGQFVTGKFQDAVSEALSRHLHLESNNQDA